MVDGMGHDLPRALWPTLIDAIADTPRAADARGAARADVASGQRDPSLRAAPIPR